MGVRDPQPRDVTIDGQLGKQYHFSGMPPVVVMRGRSGTDRWHRRGSNRRLAHGRGQESILQDENYRKLLARLTPTSSKAVLVDAGRAVDIARDFSGGGSTHEMQLAGVMLQDLRLSIVTDEAPNCLTVSIEATGLPNVPSMIKMLGSHLPRPREAR